MKLSQLFEATFKSNGPRRIISRYTPLWRAIYTMMDNIETNGTCIELYVQHNHYDGKALSATRPPAGQLIKVVCESTQGDTLYLDVWPTLSALPSGKALSPGQIMGNLKQLKQDEMLNKDVIELVKLASNGVIKLYHTPSVGECWLKYSPTNTNIAVKFSWSRKHSAAVKQA